MSAPPNKVNDLLEAVRQEFAQVSQEANSYRLQNQKDYDSKVNQQLAEMQQIRNTVYELELTHRKMKDAYEEEINRLKIELDQRGLQLSSLSAHHSQQQQLQQQQHQQQQQGSPNTANAVFPQHIQQPYQAPVGSMPQLVPAHLQQSQLPSSGAQTLPFPPGSISVAAAGQPQAPPVVAAPAPALTQPAQSEFAGSPATAPASVAPAKPAPVAAPVAPAAPIIAAVEKPAAPLPAASAAAASAAVPAVPVEPKQEAAPVPVPAIASKTEDKKTEAPAPAKEAKATSATKESHYLVPYDQRANHTKPIPPFLLDLDSQTIPAGLKKQTDDYYILYNPALPRNIDVELHKSLDHTSVVCCVRFSNDGKFLATGCNKTTQVYNVASGELIARLSDDSASHITPGQNSKDSEGGEENNDTTTYSTSATTSSDLYIRSVCFSPDGKFLATGAEDRLIRIWDIAQKKIIMVLQGHEQDIYSLDYFPSGEKLVSGSGDRTVRIWDLRTGQCSLTLSIEDGVTTVAVSPEDGKYIAAGSLDRAVRVWDSETGFLVERLDSENELGTGHKDSVYSVVFTRDGNNVVSGSLDRSVKLWNLNDANNKDLKPNVPGTCEVTYTGHKDFVLSVATTQGDEYILSGSKDRGVLFWDTKSGNPLLMLQGHRNSVISVAVANGHPLGTEYGVFATGSGDCKARIWKYRKIADSDKM
ncbi:hypothetical protein TPHA_0M02000 [Tetrapisispora phaffii CBS 4417]|uniref:General transcriptional corepressor TUP1 n=1 Tax=Tetrapisispora phaffii (strain ATCC 24235 / CBS 4417 / NBRC 1672 / NRRL Y-8282 / UCD 70-5) TaxID=1071381 RepID=G8C0R0_TETPH|nr:hypothetical protein TPHA_0M02000 [Tetrapisispora phaffii CBS 4417]CCE65775.1 hypothetical protein TPHA_0M02000 [Tetrapisispora phaffii CBS 4417]